MQREIKIKTRINQLNVSIDTHNTELSEIQKYLRDYNKSPGVSVLANLITERNDLNETSFKSCEEVLNDLGKTKSEDMDWLKHETEKWAKDAAIYNGIVDSIAILEGKDTIPEDRGIFLNKTYRLNSKINNFISSVT